MTINEIRGSGLLELYVIGSLEEEELTIVENAILTYPTLKEDIREIEYALFEVANAYAIPPHGSVKPLLMATIDYIERIKSGEIPCSPPLLRTTSNVNDFEEWLNRSDMRAPDDFDAMYAKIIADEPEKLTAIVWLRYGAPPEIHTKEHERFLIVEGSCDITIGEVKHQLNPGDYLAIPLHISHHVVVTSNLPCKIILQRVAA